MEHVGVRPSAFSYTPLMYGYCLTGRMDEAKKVFDGMVSIDLSPDEVTYNTLLHCCWKAGRVVMHIVFSEKC